MNRSGENGIARHLLGAFLSFIVPLTLFAQTNPITITFEHDAARTSTMRSLRQTGIDYGSLADLGKALKVVTRENTSARSLTMQLPDRELTFISANTFVVLIERSSQKASTLQIPAAPIAHGSSIYFPVAAFASAFTKMFGTTAVYNSSTRILSIGKRPPPAFDISSVKLEPKANGMLIRIAATKQLEGYEGILQEDGWLYVTIPKVKADVAALNKVKPVGAVKKVVAIQSQTSVQLTFKLDGSMKSSEVLKDEFSNDLLITLRGLSEETMAAYQQQRRANDLLTDQRKKHRLDVIVLDAGHGGKDPGTIGVTGTKEKNIALSVVLKLGALIEKNMKGVKVVYTRDDDTFVELDRRGQIANEADGKLFISIHCNSMPKKPSPQRGFEVYLLRPGRTDEAIDIAERENSVIELEENYEQRYRKLTDENFILVTMAQTAHMRGSEMFAEITSREMDKQLSTQSRGVKQAGFYVLVGSAMPNALIELGYLSNREEEKYLKLESTHDKYAEAILSAIKRYKVEYEKLLLEGEDLGKK